MIDTHPHDPLSSRSELPAEAASPRLCDHVGDLSGLSSSLLSELEVQMQHVDVDLGRLTVLDILYVRTDGQIALHPLACGYLPAPVVDRFLDDCLALADIESTRAGYYYPERTLDALIHGAACGTTSIKPSTYYPLALREAMSALRGQGLITNVGQSGCGVCGQRAMQTIVDLVHAAGGRVRGHADFPAQSSPENIFINYGSLEPEVMSSVELGEQIVATFDKFEIPYEWTGDESMSIWTYPDPSA